MNQQPKIIQILRTRIGKKAYGMHVFVGLSDTGEVFESTLTGKWIKIIDSLENQGVTNEKI